MAGVKYATLELAEICQVTGVGMAGASGTAWQDVSARLMNNKEKNLGNIINQDANQPKETTIKGKPAQGVF